MKFNNCWDKIFDDYQVATHDFDQSPFPLSANQIKEACQEEPRILCKQDSRESRPDVFKEHNLFLLPVKNGHYLIIRGEGYVDVPAVKEKEEIYLSKLKFSLDTIKVGDSEMQHLDYAYASSLIRTLMKDNTLILTIRGRKFTPEFEFFVGRQTIKVSSVQTEVDAGYEGKDRVVLIEAKNTQADNTIIRQLFYPFRQWKKYTSKKVITLFFEKNNTNLYSIWQFKFNDENNYNSIELVKSKKFYIKEK